MILVLILLIIFLIKLVNLVAAKQQSIAKKVVLSEDFEKESLKRARVTNRPLIEEWILQLNASKTRPTITYWDFATGSAEKIRFTLLNESTVRYGTLHFKTDHSKPRVSQMDYEEADGKTKRFSGYIIKDYTVKQFKANLYMDMSDKDKMAYINDVATTAFMQGGATLDILKYEKISKQEFEERWNKTKVKAFCQMLVEEKIFASAKAKGESLIMVTPFTEPE